MTKSRKSDDYWNPVKPAQPLIARQALGADKRQFNIRGMAEGREWDDQYVEFSGYFGSYGPHVFAAAPDLLAAIKAALPYIDLTSRRGTEAMKAMQAAVAKAEGSI